MSFDPTFVNWHTSGALVLLIVALADGPCAGEPPGSDRASKLGDRLEEGLKRFPEADLNHDGKLTIEEARGYLKQRRGAGDGLPAIPPTIADVAYGAHPRERLDLWRSASTNPAPVVIFIHGGGFVNGDKSTWRTSRPLQAFREAGFACAAINYPFREDAPIQEILRHIGRAVQFLRAHAGEWNLDKAHFAGWGSSAGAGSSLWLVTRDDLADPDNADPVLRESSRLQAAVLIGTQATYNLPRWEAFVGPPKPDWLQDPDELIQFYHFKGREDLDSPGGRAVLDECDMLRWIGPGDGGLFIIVNQPPGEPRSRGHWLHHPKHAEEIRKACAAARVDCVVQSKGAASDDAVRFLTERLTTR